MSTASDGELGCWQSWHSPDMPLRIGVSSCLLGEKVRFDGQHSRSRFVADTLAQWFEYVPTCPEMGIGMGTPRPTIRLVDDSKQVRLQASASDDDFTDAMLDYSRRKIEELMAQDLDGYIVKSNSPTCGFDRIRVYRKDMPVRRNAAGMFTQMLKDMWPGLPIEDEGRLNDNMLRENFIERVFSRNRWRNLVAKGLTRGRLVEFHTAHKLLLRAHNEAGYRRLGKIVGSVGSMKDAELYRQYELEFQDALRARSTTKKNTNVLYHAMGYLKKLIGSEEKAEILNAIEDYRKGLLPLVVPLTLIRYNVRRHGIEYLAGQLYLDPHPKELMLRNHA